MPWAAAAVVGGALIGSAATNSASKRQARSADNATQAQIDMYDQTRTDNLPALDARNASLARMQSLLGIGGRSDGSSEYGTLGGSIEPTDVANDPGYQFGLSEGLKAQSNLAGARGMRNSGAALKQAARYGTNYATTKYDTAFNRVIANRNAQLNPLQSLAGLGQTGATTIAGAGQNAANNVSSNIIGAGNAGAANSLAQGNIWGNAANQLVSQGNQNGWWSKTNNLGSDQNGVAFTNLDVMQN